MEILQFETLLKYKKKDGDMLNVLFFFVDLGVLNFGNRNNMYKYFVENGKTKNTK